VEPFDTWKKDPEFNGLPDAERTDICLHFFDKNMVDEEFNGLPFKEQKDIKSHLLGSMGLKYETEIPTTITRIPKMDKSHFGLESAIDVPLEDSGFDIEAEPLPGIKSAPSETIEPGNIDLKNRPSEADNFKGAPYTKSIEEYGEPLSQEEQLKATLQATNMLMGGLQVAKETQPHREQIEQQEQQERLNTALQASGMLMKGLQVAEETRPQREQFEPTEQSISTITGKPIPTAEEKIEGGRVASNLAPYAFASAFRGLLPPALEHSVMQPIMKSLGRDYVSPIDRAIRIYGEGMPESTQKVLGTIAQMSGAIVPISVSFKTASAIMKAAGLPANVVLKSGSMVEQIAGHILVGLFTAVL